MIDNYVQQDGIYVPPTPVDHREDEYDSTGFDVLRNMQEQHFWYRGRHRFLFHQLNRVLRHESISAAQAHMIDVGGGCGGWIKYLLDKRYDAAELALGDSSTKALEYAAKLLPPGVKRYQLDLTQPAFADRWNVAFLLDVLEHIPDDESALRQIQDILQPGGLLFVTTPALQRFWTWNDVAAHHVRRYCKADYVRLAKCSGYELVDCRYFMFFLSPLLLASRWFSRTDFENLSIDDQHELVERMHEVPPSWMNRTLEMIFSLETPTGHLLPFPWGTSILAVMRKPIAEQSILPTETKLQAAA